MVYSELPLSMDQGRCKMRVPDFVTRDRIQ